MRCARYETDKRSQLNAKKDVENVAVTMSDRVKKRNDISPRRCQNQSSSSCKTPVTRKQYTNADAEESPDLDYSPSLMLPPCTQEGGNEIAWDWHSSLSRTPENKKKKQKVQYETPKGTKLLQRKRHSNSPLLKPFKKKIIKMENIENMGQFAAELQELNEKVRVMKQNDKNHSSDCFKEEDAPMLMNTSSKEETSEIKEQVENKWNSIGTCSNDNKQNSNGETYDHNNSSKMEASGIYDSLFDDPIDDDIIRCTQEIEEKFNLMERGNSALSQVKQEESCTSNKISIQFSSSSSENYSKPSDRNILRASDNNTLKTYSKLSLKQDTNSSIHAAAHNSKDPYKPCVNNNNMIHSHVKELYDKKLSKKETADLYNFPDDSFDDLFNDFVEDEKLLEKFDDPLIHKDNSTKFQINYKRLANAPLKSETKSADLLKPTVKPDTSNASNLLANRKFFKTKSLSEQYVNRDANTNLKGMTNSTKSMKSSRSSISHTSVARAPVSTKSIITNDGKAQNNSISLMRGTDRTHGSDVNRYAVKSDGNRFVKHHSTGNMKTDSQTTTRCTAEEIERKRLQAVARLEARRKLHFTKITNNINR